MGSRLEQKSSSVRKRIESHAFDGEQGDEYGASAFGGFNEYFRRKKIKLQNLDAELRAQSTDKPQIFKGLVCHVNGYTQPSLNDLHTMIVQHGGGFIQYLDGKTMVTHIIASNLTPKKKEEFKRYRIVKPAWIVESIAASRILPWDDYRVIDEGAKQKILGFEAGQIVNQTKAKTSGYRDQTETSWYTDQLKADEKTASESAANCPDATQVVTPDDIDDDEFPMTEITSSIERALGQQTATEVASRAHKVTQAITHESKTFNAIQTPPPSSPLLPVQEAVGYPLGQGTGQGHGLQPSDVPHESEVSLAVIRESKALQAVSPSRLAEMTAEEYNALLLSDPKIRKSTVVHPDFLEQYYRESRLHHLSAWKADLKSQLQALAAEKSSSQKVKLKKLPGQRRYIMHVDFDSFFAAVSLKKYPQYLEKPAVVAHGGGSGSEIASCNYIARKFGVSNGMWMKRAQDLCPELKILPYDFPEYEAASREFYDSIMATGGIVQSVSIDEALVDISGICFAESGTDGVKRYEGAVHREQSKAEALAQNLRNEVVAKTGCAVSVGIGGNILLAKVALRKAKPAGQYQLKPEDVLDFIGELEVQKLPGVAWSIGGKLDEVGIKLVKDIRQFPREKLLKILGPKTSEKLWDYARGIDRAEIGDQVVRKSVSAEVNWGVRFETQDQVDEFMYGLSGELQKRLWKERVKGKQLTMKVMRRAADAPRDPPKHLGHGKCDTFNRSTQLGIATNEAELIAKEAIAMMKSFGISPGELRGIGVQMQKLEPIKIGAAEQGSQRRLQFKVEQPPKAPQARSPEDSHELLHDPVQTGMEIGGDKVNANTTLGYQSKSLNEPGTPKKRPLNIGGTQFLLPTQVDPSVLAELPEDIQQRLAKYAKPVKPREREHTNISQAAATHVSSAIALPNQSQLDPTILEALPEDVRNEILGFYKSPSRRGKQALLPQSPRKNRTAPATKQPLKRKRGGGLFSGRPRASAHDNSTLTQSNFISRQTTHPLDGTDTEPEPEELDQAFLAALPTEIRHEVLDQQRQARLQRTGGIDVSHHQRSKARKKKTDEDVPIERTVYLPRSPPQPSFTSRKLTKIAELRDAIKAWYVEFLDEGPYHEDVKALVKYLREVVCTERDLDKAVAVTKWMAWIIDEVADVSHDVRNAWFNALNDVKEGVQGAVKDRGLGSVELD
nr:dna repair protein rev1 [Quercus suber]